MNRKFSFSHPLLALQTALVLQLVFHSIAIAAPVGKSTLRVGLTRFSGARQVSVMPTCGCGISEKPERERLAPLAPVVFQAGGSEIVLKRDKGEPIGVGVSVTIKPDDPGGTVAIGSQNRTGSYRGSVELTLESGSIRVVNVICIEDYLRGVVPVEMSTRDPIEALKAQAIAARTYSSRDRGRHRSQGFDVCDTVDCQAYQGASVESAATDRAVAETRGLVITYNGEIAQVMYSSSCGGATENAAALRSLTDCPYLCGVTEPAGVVHACWERSFAVKDVEKALVSKDVKEAEGLAAIGVTQSSPSGRALWIEVRGSKSAKAITGERVRKALSLPSTLFRIETPSAGSVVFKGSGAGHGVGLCQTGAIALASAPLNYTCGHILAHYFPGTEIAPLGGEAPVVAKIDVDAAQVPPSQPSEGKSGASKPRAPANTKREPGELNLRLEEPHF